MFLFDFDSIEVGDCFFFDEEDFFFVLLKSYKVVVSILFLFI